MWKFASCHCYGTRELYVSVIYLERVMTCPLNFPFSFWHSDSFASDFLHWNRTQEKCEQRTFYEMVKSLASKSSMASEEDSAWQQDLTHDVRKISVRLQAFKNETLSLYAWQIFHVFTNRQRNTGRSCKMFLDLVPRNFVTDICLIRPLVLHLSSDLLQISALEKRNRQAQQVKQEMSVPNEQKFIKDLPCISP